MRHCPEVLLWYAALRPLKFSTVADRSGSANAVSRRAGCLRGMAMFVPAATAEGFTVVVTKVRVHSRFTDRRDNESGMSEVHNAAFEAFEEAVASHTVGIVGTRNGKEGTGIGTGAAVIWKGKAIVLTAWHVVRESPRDRIWFLLRPKGTLVRYVTGRRPPPSAPQDRYLREPIPIQEITEDEKLDVAAIQVPLRMGDQHPVVCFHDLSAQSAVATTGVDVILRGHPSALAQPVGANFEVFANHEYTTITNDRPAGILAKEAQFFMKWSSAADWDPYGFSGAGVWFDSGPEVNATALWCPRPGLAGLATSYFPKSELMMAVEIEAVKDFLDRTIV
jgi:hypothetical protein